MLDASQPWSLFGFDLSRAVHYVRAGWGEFLWGGDSPVYAAVDEVVLTHLDSGEECHYKAGRRVSPPAEKQDYAEAVVLPDRLALVKSLWIPVAAEPNLDAVVALEVGSSSPFPESDTCFGWRINERREAEMEVILCISSRSAVMAYIAERYGTHDVHAFEVWGLVDDRIVVLSGFGEQVREQRNRKRLVRMGVACGYCLVLLVVSCALAAGVKYLELQKVREQQQQAENSAGSVLQLRESLATARGMIGAAAGYLEQYPSPRGELARLAATLGDETWLSQFEIRGGEIKIEGQSANAPAVMQLLLDNPAYSHVEAPLAFTKQRSGNERFVLELTRAGSGEVE